MPLPVILGAAKGALAVAKAAKAAKALKAAKAMKAAGTAAKGAKAAKAAGAPKKLMTEGFNNVGSKANLKASKEKLKTAKKQERLQKGADRLVKRDQRRTEMKKNMEARAKQQEQQSSGESKKKKESIKELYDKSREGLERKDRRSAAMSNFATKGTMKHGGKYEDGGRKRPLKKLKGAIQKANYKAGAVKNRLEKKVLDAVKRKKAEKGMKYEEGGKKSASGVTSVTKRGRRVTEANTSGKGLERSVTTRRGKTVKSKTVTESRDGANYISKTKRKGGELMMEKKRRVTPNRAARAGQQIENIVRKDRGLKPIRRNRR